ncbi:MAG: type II secretion system protein [Rickettsiales bacterium]|nr:type II secretion system protein [Rickettsiales bacterium]
MKKRAFTLLELSLVVLIISILVVGSISASITTVNKAKYKSTKERMDVIYRAMGNYLVNNGALPCPAAINLVDSSASYGLSGSGAGDCNNSSEDVFDGGTNLVYGMVPIQDLNLPSDMAKDGFGTKFTYIVNVNFTDPSHIVFDGSGAGNISINEAVSGGTQPITTEAMFVLISHGENKFGGFNSNSSTQNPVSNDNDESSNYGGTFNTGDNTAIFDNSFVAKSINSEDFDDIIYFKTRNQMVVDFDAYEIIECEAITDESYARCVGSECDWVKSKFGQIVPSTTACDTGYKATVSSPTKRCGAFGVWDTGYIDPCAN